MTIDPTLARSLGFPTPKYTGIERERRWLCAYTPSLKVIQTLDVTDIYVTGTRLRLREALPADGSSANRFRLTKKGDVDSRHRLLTSIYLSETEFGLLKDALKGPVIKKRRFRLEVPHGMSLSYDVFQGALAGLVTAEAEFASDELMDAFPLPEFALRETTDDPRYGGGHLALHGLPKD